MTKNAHGDAGTQNGNRHCSKSKITSLSTFHKKVDYHMLKSMLEYERPEIFVEFCDAKKEIRFVFEKQPILYIR